MSEVTVAALALIADAASGMQESSELCAHVHEKLEFVFTKLRAMENKGTLPDAAIVRDYARLVSDFGAFVAKRRGRPWLFRLLTYKRALSQVRAFQDSLATLLLALNLCHIDAMADERANMAAFRRRQEYTITCRLTDDATIAREVRREVQQVEALSVLRHELQAAERVTEKSVPASNRDTSAEAATALGQAADLTVLRAALAKVIRLSTVEVHSVPEWFLPSHRVEFEHDAFARGSFGTVHYGKWEGVDVVVKCLLVETRDNEAVKSRFRCEAGLWFTLRHKHVLPMFGACDVSTPPFIVCELAKHGNLSHFLGKASNRPAMFRLLREAAVGLAYLHDNRVVHGDLKCDNILVANDRIAKIADFSFSYVRSMSASKHSSVADGSIGRGASQAGALRWRAPECLNGRRPTFASDVYSLGMCIIEAVSQEPPWLMIDDDTVRDLVKRGELPEQPEIVSDRVWGLVKRMCSFHTADRPTLACIIKELGELSVRDSELAQNKHAVSSLSHMTRKHAARQSEIEAGAKSSNFPCSQELTAAQVVQYSPAEHIEVIKQRYSIPQQPEPEPPMKTLVQAVRDDDVASLETLLQSASSLKQPVDERRSNLLICAAMIGAIKVAEHLVARGASILASTSMKRVHHGLEDSNCTALHFAARFGHVEVVRTILRAGKNFVDVRTGKSRTALYFAARFGHARVFEALLWHGAAVQLCEAERGVTALSVAAAFGQLRCVRWLLKRRSIVHMKSADGSSALHEAAFRGHADVVSELLRNGARVNECDNKGLTPLFWSATGGSLVCARVLLQSGADIHARSKRGATALHEAAGKGHSELARELLRNWARVDERDINGWTPLVWATIDGKLASVRVLLQYKADANAEDSKCSVVLCHAAAKGRADIAAELLRFGARVNERDTKGRTPLLWAAMRGDDTLVWVLLQSGADVNAKAADGSTALRVAVKRSHLGVARVLLLAAAKVDERTEKLARSSEMSEVLQSCRSGTA